MAEVNKVIGPAGYWCKCCAHCETVELGCMDDVPIYICTDPYDGVENRIPGDENITCTMFNLANEVPVFKATKVKPIEEDKNLNVLISDLYKQIQDLKSDNARLDKLYSERDRELNGLIKASKRKDELIQSYREKLKGKDNEINLLNSKLDKLREYYRTDEKLIDNIQKVIFPQEEGSDYTYSYEEILNKVKDLKVQSDENGTMYEDLKYWKERCHNAESDVTTLNSKVEVLDKRNTNQAVIIGERDKEIEELKKMVERRDMWVNDLQIDANTLQNEILEIRNIAQKAYDDTNKD